MDALRSLSASGVLASKGRATSGAMVKGTMAQVSRRRMILLMKDDPGMANEIARRIEESGYEIEVLDDLELAHKAIHANDIVLLIADRVLHGTDSISMIARLRDEGIQIPVLFVSALATVDERIRGLKAGGDDYITKPFALGELAARVEALLRRANTGGLMALRAGPLKLHLVERRVWRGKREILLLPREFKLLEYMMRRPNQIITRTMLLEDLWASRLVSQTNVVDVHISKVRHKVDRPGEIRLIRGVRRAGFMLQAVD